MWRRPYAAAVVLSVVSTVTGGPTPQHDINGGYLISRATDPNVDVFSDKVVSNRKIRKDYIACFLDNGPCSPEAQVIKRK